MSIIVIPEEIISELSFEKATIDENITFSHKENQYVVFPLRLTKPVAIRRYINTFLKEATRFGFALVHST